MKNEKLYTYFSLYIYIYSFLIIKISIRNPQLYDNFQWCFDQYTKEIKNMFIVIWGYFLLMI